MTTYYVDSAATGTADGLSEANAFTTIDAAMNIMATAGAGPHTVYVKATATYDENGNIDTAGSNTAVITFEGYTTTTGDNGKVTWTNSSGSALTDTPAGSYYVFKNFKFNGCSSSGVAVASYLAFINCEFTSNGGAGYAGAASYTVFLNCIFANNTSQGFSSTNSTRARFLGCIAYGNGNENIKNSGVDTLFYKCVSYAPAAGNDVIYNNADFSITLGCTIDGDGTTGSCFDANTENQSVLTDCILYDASVGVTQNDSGGTINWQSVFSYNLVNSLTNVYYTGSAALTGPLIGIGDVTGAPAFTDEAGDDYRLGEGSPAIGSGVVPGGIT